MNIRHIKPDGGSTLGVSVLLGLRPKYKLDTVCPAATKQKLLTCCRVQGKGPDELLGYCWTESGLALGQNKFGP